MLDLSLIPAPDVIETLNYEDRLKENLELFKSRLNDDELILLESDEVSALIESLTYIELSFRARVNEALRQALFTTAKGANLDNVTALHFINRLQGEKPSANFEFSLTLTQSTDTVLPAGLVLTDGEGHYASLTQSVIIPAQSKTATGVAKLEEFTATSSIKTEFIITPLPFVVSAKQLSEFSDGASVESDEAFKNRAILSVERPSTAGSKKAYEYHAYTANAKVIQALAENNANEAGVVRLHLKTSDMSEQTRKSVEDYISAEKTRPLTDKLIVLNATKIPVQIKAVIELTDLAMQDEVDRKIKANFPTSLGLGEDLNLSYIYKNLHVNGFVYRVNLITPAADMKFSISEFASITLILSYKKASL